ncbi:MAG TPA: TIGR01777 family oxidoreductase [Terriglobia bacterium]|nr:TIGR01777 family oxidoreductase [Terriglobia bacterium]
MMKILITGSSGLIGSAVVAHLAEQGHRVVRLVRRAVSPGEDAVEWDPAAEKLESSALEQAGAVVHLAGESINALRWTGKRKERIRNSRVRGTQLLSESLAQLAFPPRVLVSASAVGFYGSRGDEVLTEESPAGSGFLSEVCQEWEAATQPARQKGVRVVNLRFGMVLSGKGGALPAMLPAFKAGVAGKLGDGRQFVSWIAVDDLKRAISHAITTGPLSGPVNAVSPNPVRNVEMTKALGKVLRRPTFLSIPAFAVRLLFGEMGESLLLSSQRAEPRRLLDSGFTFRFPDFETSLRHLLGRP